MRNLNTLLLALIFSLSLVAQVPDNYGTLINSVDLGSQTPTPDRSIVGIQYAEGNLWVTGFDPDDYWQHKLYKFNEDGSELLDVYSYGIEAAGWKDMAYDGEFLYVTDMDTIRQISTIDGQKTGVTIPAPFYYNSGLAYNPLSDHFYVSGEGGFNIYEIDRDGNILGAVPGSPENSYSGLAIDTVSPGGPLLWTYLNEAQGYNLVLKAKQISCVTNQYTGEEFEGATISPIIVESAGGATISYDFQPDSVTLITINIRNGNINDQMEYAMFYDITRTDIPGPEITVNPEIIQNTLVPGDSLDIEVEVSNTGTAPLIWSAYIETPDQDTVNHLGDLMSSFNATLQTPGTDRGLNGLTYLNDLIYVNGRNFPSQQSIIYAFDKSGQLLSQHPYNTISNVGYRAITNDGTYLYGEDTYAITQIDPETFSVVGYIIQPSGSASGLTYDPATDHFWRGNGVGLIKEFDRDGNEINVFITDYDIQGMAWDRWSPGGPFLWVWVETSDAQGSKIEAIKLDPHTCTPVGDSFKGFNFSNVSGSQDIPKGATITSDWEENMVTLIGLQNADILNGSDTLVGADFVAVYDLDVVPPPGWIELIDQQFGVTLPAESGQFTVRLRSIMNDTIMTAVIRIQNNDILQPEVVIPVTFTMTDDLTTEISNKPIEDLNLLGQNYPNPFSQSTVIPLELPSKSSIVLNLYNNSGRLVAKLYDGNLNEGTHEFRIESGNLPPGIYYYSLQLNNEIVTRKMVIKK